MCSPVLCREQIAGKCGGSNVSRKFGLFVKLGLIVKLFHVFKSTALLLFTILKTNKCNSELACTLGYNTLNM